MSSIDNRVVEMEFDNKQFESGVQTTLTSLDKLKQGLKLEGVQNGFKTLQTSANSVSFASMENSLKTISARFSTLGIVGMSVLNNLATTAMRVGYQLVQNVIQPMQSGFAEYELQLNSVQTILANTMSKGTNIDQVNAALNELNKYADQTIYNFAQMTHNIGTFTAAGVDLETSVDSIKGIANLAAASGSSATQASTAMYQLSQAIANGKVNLQDWNSVVNAGMGGELFQNALKRTAEHFGTNVDAMIKKYGSFRESLTKGEWLTTEVLTETLRQISGAYSEADLVAQGYTEAQAKEIVQLADTATKAATQVKTFTQLIDTAKEALGSGWTKSWEYVLGDYEEAAKGWTKISSILDDIISKSADARNAVLLEAFGSGYKQFIEQGISDTNRFKEVLSDTAKSYGVDIDSMTADGTELIDTFTQGWVTGGMLKETIAKMIDEVANMSQEELAAKGYTSETVEELKKLNEGLQNGSISADEFASKMSRLSGREVALQGILNIFETLQKVMGTVKEAASEVFPALSGEDIYSLITAFEDLTKKLIPTEEALAKIKRAFVGLFSIFDIGRQGILAVATPLLELFQQSDIEGFSNNILDAAANLGDFFTNLNASIKAGEGFRFISDGISASLSGILGVGQKVLDVFRGMGDIDIDIAGGIGRALEAIKNTIGDILSWITGHISIGDVINGILGALAIQGAADFVQTLKTIKGALEDFTSGGIMSLFFGGGKGDDGGIPASGTMDALKESVTTFFGSLHDTLTEFQTGIKVGSLVAIAVAITLLVSSIETLASLNPVSIAVGIDAIGALLVELSASFIVLMKAMSKFQGGAGVLKGAASMILIAYAVKQLAEALVIVSDLDFNGISGGLTALGLAMMEFHYFLKTTDFSGLSLSSSASFLVLALSLEVIADVMAKIGGMGWEEIAKGLVGMGVALAELAGVSVVLGKFGGGSSILGGAAILLSAMSLKMVAEYLQDVSSLSWDQIQNGLGAMAAALVILGGMSLITGLGGLSSIFGAGSILIAVQALKPLGEYLQDVSSLSWDQIQDGLTAMSQALAVLVGASFVSGLSGFAGLLGSISIVAVVQALDPLVDYLQEVSTLSWGEIQNGLSAMAQALVILGGSSMIAGIGGLAGLLGSVSINAVVEALDPLADVLKKFGSMDWTTIQTGLTAMAGALSATALGGLANTLSGFGAGAIAEMAEPLGVLADSVKKWAGVKVPEDLGTSLATLADGVAKFTFQEWGANALATAAPGLLTMANAIMTFSLISIPEGLSEFLGELATAVGKFAFKDIFGAGGIEASAEGLKQMAEALTTWKDVVLPVGMNDALESLATGISNFGLADVFSGWSLETVASGVKTMGEAMAAWSGVSIPPTLDFEAFVTSINKLTEIDIDADLGTNLKNVADALSSIDGIDLTDEATSIRGIISAIAYGENFDLTALATDVSTAVNQLASAFATAFTGQSSNVGTSITNMLGVAIANASSSAKSDFTSTGETLASSLAEGLESGEDQIVTAGEMLVSSLKEGIDVDALKSTGRYLMQGLASGIAQGRSQAVTAAKNAVRAAITAANAEAGIASPSKVFIKIGDYMMQGLANGIRDNANLAEDASERAIQPVISTASMFAQRLSDAMAKDYAPVITPVLDDKSIRSDMASLNSSLSGSLAASTSGRMAAINSRAASKLLNQNGTDQVVKELSRLRGDISNLEGSNTYIDGISYAEGTPVGDAVSQLIQAIKVERRI